MHEMKLLVGMDIEFLPGIEDYDSYVETGMRATVSDVIEYPENGLYKLVLDYKKFLSHNVKYETLRFFDSETRTHLTFRELNGVEESESYCVSASFDNYRLLNDDTVIEFILH